MKIKVRLSRLLDQEVRADLSRPHPFAAERVGLLYGRLCNAGLDTSVVLMTGYEPLADERYKHDPSSGARIDSQAIRIALQGCLTVGGRLSRSPARMARNTSTQHDGHRGDSTGREQLSERRAELRRTGWCFSALKIMRPGFGFPESSIRLKRRRSPLSAFRFISLVENSDDADRFSRQSFLGENSQLVIERVTVGIVGLGGGGGHVVQQLAHVGFLNYIIYDGDTANVSNLDRLVTANEADSEAAIPKIGLAHRRILAIRKALRVEAIPYRWQDHQSLFGGATSSSVASTDLPSTVNSKSAAADT